ncbi:hypothetical protein AcW1_001980 [Taiwanofungus camphoratus]|nr:hypothetical protein AcW1_001980 [Antrodia cinnamomea]
MRLPAQRTAYNQVLDTFLVFFSLLGIFISITRWTRFYDHTDSLACHPLIHVMRFSIVTIAAIAVAAPALAAPSGMFPKRQSTGAGSAAISKSQLESWGKDALDVAGAILPFVTRDVSSTPGSAAISKSQLESWGKDALNVVGTVAPLFLDARDVEARSPLTHAQLERLSKVINARDAASTDGSAAISKSQLESWGKDALDVAGIVLPFVTRDVSSTSGSAAISKSQLESWGKDALNVVGTIAPFLDVRDMAERSPLTLAQLQQISKMRKTRDTTSAAGSAAISKSQLES